MAQLRIAGVQAGPPPAATAQLRVAGAQASGTAAVSARLRIAGAGAYGVLRPGAGLRIAGVKASGTAAVLSRLRVAGARVVGVANIALRSVSDRTFDPFETVSTTVAPLSGGTPSSYEWRQIDGPVVKLIGLGATRTFETLGTLDRHTVVLGVTAVDTSGNRSPELRVTVTVRAQTMWISDGANWKPMPVLWSSGSAWVGTPFPAN
jgi:hypothetical protein